MKKLRLVSLVVLAVTVVGMALWRLALPEPDWLVRLQGILMLAALFGTAFTTVRIAMCVSK